MHRLDEYILHTIARYMGRDALVLRLVTNVRFLDDCVSVFETAGNDYNQESVVRIARILSVVTIRVIDSIIRNPLLIRFCPMPLLKMIVRSTRSIQILEMNEEYGWKCLMPEVNIDTSTFLKKSITSRVVYEMDFIHPCFRIARRMSIDEFIESMKDINRPCSMIYDDFVGSLRTHNKQLEFQIPEYMQAVIPNNDVVELERYFKYNNNFHTFITIRAKKNINGFNEWLLAQDPRSLTCIFLDVIPVNTQMYCDLVQILTKEDTCNMLHYMTTEFRHTNKVLTSLFIENINYEYIAKRFKLPADTCIMEQLGLPRILYIGTIDMKVNNDLLILFNIVGTTHTRPMILSSEDTYYGQIPITANVPLDTDHFSELMKDYKKGDKLLDQILHKHSLLQRYQLLDISSLSESLMNYRIKQ